MRAFTFLAVAAVATLTGCSRGDTDKPSTDTQASGPSAAAVPGNQAKDSKDGLVSVALDPLPLKIKVAPGGLGAMDMSMGDKKSVTVDIGDGASLNISEETKDLAAVKKSYQGDTVLFPFKKWVKQEGNLAIEQFDNSGKAGFLGFMMIEIGGKKYQCKTTGLEGVPSMEAASKNLEACGRVTAK